MVWSLSVSTMPLHMDTNGFAVHRVIQEEFVRLPNRCSKPKRQHEKHAEAATPYVSVIW